MRRKILPLAATTVALILGMGMGSAWAYFTDTTSATGALEILPETTHITEENGAGTKTIRIQNTSKKPEEAKDEETQVWVRVRVFAAAELGADASGDKWSGTIDGWFTYGEPLPAGEETEPLNVKFALKHPKADDYPEGAESGDETNVVVVYECVPVSYNADGTLVDPVWNK